MQEKSSIRIIADQLTPLVPLWIALIVGIVIGVFWGWQLSPVQWTDAAPVHLAQEYKVEWLKLTADQYIQYRDRAQAERLLAILGTKDVDSAFSDLISDQTQAQKLSQLKEIYDSPAVQTAAQDTQSSVKGGSNGIPFNLIIFIILIIVVWGVVQIARKLPLIAIFRGLFLMRRSRGESTGPAAETRLDGIKAARELAQTQATDFSATELGPPIVQYMSTYLLGDDLYDDSFSVETASGEFLGETGAGISETMGVGDPKKVTAIEAWLFDKNDIRTVTKVMMSEHAYHDEAIRAKLAPKGEAVLVEPNTVITLNTRTLRVQARVVDMAYGPAGPLPENSYFERLTIELAAWPIEDAGMAIEDFGSDDLPSPDAFGDTMPF